jgi:hypothetical protein
MEIRLFDFEFDLNIKFSRLNLQSGKYFYVDDFRVSFYRKLLFIPLKKDESSK